MESLLIEKRNISPWWVNTPVPKWYKVFTPSWIYSLIGNFSNNPMVYNTSSFDGLSPQFRNMFYLLLTMFYQVNQTNMFNWHMHSKMLCMLSHLLCVNYGISPQAFPAVNDMIFWAMAKIPLPDMLHSVCYKFLKECNYTMPCDTIYVDIDPDRFYKFTVDSEALVTELIG